MPSKRNEHTDGHLDYFYYMLNRDCENNGVWYEFRIPTHSFGLLIKIEPDSFRVEIGNNKKWWFFNNQGFKFGFMNRLLLGEQKATEEFKRFLRRHGINMVKGADVVWKFWDKPIIVIPKMNINETAALSSQVFINLFQYRDIEKLIVEKIEPYTRGGNA